MKRGQAGLYCTRPRGQTGLHKIMRTDWIIQDKRRDRDYKGSRGQPNQAGPIRQTGLDRINRKKKIRQNHRPCRFC
jgi:hypothetical protein